jgi:hypothetical protein
MAISRLRDHGRRSGPWRGPIARGAAALLGLGVFALAPVGAATLTLSGAQEVPPVTTSASASGSITVADDGAVSGGITTSGIAATMAHIHSGAAGANGPVVIPLARDGDSRWSVPAGAKLSAEQLRSYRAGALYVNVHSAAHPGGELRAQLEP